MNTEPLLANPRSANRLRARFAAAVALVALVALAACTSPFATPEDTFTGPLVVASSTVGVEDEPSVTPEAPAPPPATVVTATPAPVVTVTATPSAAPVVTPPPAPSPSPTPVVTPASDPNAPSVVVSKGPVAPGCAHSVCHYVHVKWKNLSKGGHDTQCVTDAAGLGTWSRSTYNYPSSSGEQNLGCFLGYDGNHVWVIIDGTLESAHIDW